MIRHILIMKLEITLVVVKVNKLHHHIIIILVGSNSSAATSSTNTYAPVIPIPPNTPNLFQFATREPAVELGKLQLGDEYENANLMMPGKMQPDYSIPRYISLPEAPDANL